MDGFTFVQDLAVILLVAGLAGWGCQRLGLSVVVGFLVAGMVVGPYRQPFSLVADVGRIETLGQVGLVFLMFGIGLGLSLRKLRRLGFELLLATAIGALLMFYLTRWLCAAMGWGTTEGLFLAGMLMVSSSAIIGKVLQETGANHERAGQLAMGVSVLEDIVAVVMLTLLTSLVQLGGAGAGTETAGVLTTLGKLGAFVVLAGLGGLLLVPWLLKKMSISADEELQTLGLAALLFGLAVLAHRAGYSLALGAFLLGTIVAETPHRHQVERTFTGMKDVFSAVFFVAIGMQIDVRELAANAGVIAGIAGFVLAARPLAVTTGLVLIGTPPKDALRTGLAASPVGEFSFVIAQLGVGAALVPPRFYPLAVGVSLLTTLAAPTLTRRSEAIADFWFTRQPQWLGAWQRYYQEWLERFRREQKRSPLWQLSRKRFVQIGVEMLAVSGLLVFSGQIFAVVEHWLGRDWGVAHGPEIIFWTGMSLVLLAPLVAIWRNCSALALLFAQVSTQGHPQAARLAPVVETGLKMVAGAGLFLWLMAILPAEGTARWLLLASALAAVGALIVLRQRLIYWHSQLEVELNSAIEPGDNRMTATMAPWLQPHGDWDLQMIDCTLPDLADCKGRSIAELELRKRTGCSVVGIERQGFMIPLPTPAAVLYPRDKVLLLGTPEQVQAGKAVLGAVSGELATESLLDEVRMEVLTVSADSRAVGWTLAELAPSLKHGVQIAGLKRRGLRVLNPGAGECVQVGDELLTLGPLDKLRVFRTWLREPITGAGTVIG